MVILNSQAKARFFTNSDLISKWRLCFRGETLKMVETSELLLQYFLKNSMPEGTLFITLKDLASHLGQNQRTVTKVLVKLEESQLIYRRYGLIGLREKNEERT